MIAIIIIIIHYNYISIYIAFHIWSVNEHRINWPPKYAILTLSNEVWHHPVDILYIVLRPIYRPGGLTTVSQGLHTIEYASVSPLISYVQALLQIVYNRPLGRRSQWEAEKRANVTPIRLNKDQVIYLVLKGVGYLMDTKVIYKYHRKVWATLLQ